MLLIREQHISSHPYTFKDGSVNEGMEESYFLFATFALAANG
jgi:hypothetical protein